MNCPNIECKADLRDGTSIVRTITCTHPRETPKLIRELNLNGIFRRRRCSKCGTRFATLELIATDMNKLVREVLAAVSLPDIESIVIKKGPNDKIY